MANTRTAYRWNINGWFFKTIAVEEDPDFPGEYTLPTRSTWEVPPEDTETQWPKINTSTLTWELTDLSMAERLEENLITQEEYDTWYAQKDGQFLSVLKNRADSDANNIALISDVEAEAEYRANADSLINANIARALESIQSLSDSLAANSNADSENKTALEQAISALQQTTQALQTAINSKADVEHTHSVVTAAKKLATARKIGNTSFDGSADISLDQMGVASLVASAVAKAGNITVEESGNATNRQLIIRDTKNKIGFLFASYHGSGYAGAYGPDTPSDFDTIYHVVGSADATDTKVVMDPDMNSAYIYSASNFKNATMFFAARLK